MPRRGHRFAAQSRLGRDRHGTCYFIKGPLVTVNRHVDSFTRLPLDFNLNLDRRDGAGARFCETPRHLTNGGFCHLYSLQPIESFRERPADCHR